MRVLVTGAGGFIGSHLSERLVGEGHSVIAVDCLTDYYDVAQKRSNLHALGELPRCVISHADLRTCDLDALLDGIDVVFHQSGQPGVRASWDSGFTSYVQGNILVTQRLLEAMRNRPIERFIFASSLLLIVSPFARCSTWVTLGSAVRSHSHVFSRSGRPKDFRK